MFGVGLAIFGFGGMLERLLDDDRRHAEKWLLLFGVGSLISAAGKENFIFLVGVFAVLYSLFLWYDRLGPVAKVAGAVLIVLMLVVTYGAEVAPNIGKPTDFYGKDNSISHRLAALRSSPLLSAIIAAAGAGCAAVIIVQRQVFEH